MRFKSWKIVKFPLENSNYTIHLLSIAQYATIIRQWGIAWLRFKFAIADSCSCRHFPVPPCYASAPFWPHALPVSLPSSMHNVRLVRTKHPCCRFLQAHPMPWGVEANTAPSLFCRVPAVTNRWPPSPDYNELRDSCWHHIHDHLCKKSVSSFCEIPGKFPRKIARENPPDKICRIFFGQKIQVRDANSLPKKTMTHFVAGKTGDLL